MISSVTMWLLLSLGGENADVIAIYKTKNECLAAIATFPKDRDPKLTCQFYDRRKDI